MSKIIGKGRKTWKDGSVMTYNITDDGVLTISGTLVKNDYVSIRSNAPFRHLVIEDGITYIGHRNFAFWEEIEELTLPSSVKTIGIEAFSNCTNLRRIHFSEGLTTIMKEAFYKCSALQKFTLPASIQKIGQGAFFWCESLKKLKIPASLKRIEFQAFAGCKVLKEVSLSSGLESIRNEAFKWCDIETIRFPRTLGYIGEYAFSGSDKLKDIILPNKDITIGFYAFGPDVSCSVTGEDGNDYECWISNIPTNKNTVSIGLSDGKIAKGDIIVPGSVEYKGKTYAVTAIEESAFEGSKELTSVRLPDSIKQIKAYAFRGCSKLKVAKLGRSVRYIGEQAFEDCERLDSVDLGASLEHIGMSAFCGCGKLRELTFPNTLRTLGCRALEYAPVYEEKKGAVYLGHVLCGYNGYLPPHSCLEIREGTTVIAERAFTEVGNLEAVIFPNTVKSIGYCSFVDCTDLKCIKLPRSLEYIGDDAFSYTQVKEIVAPWKKPVYIDYAPFPKNAVIYIPKGSMAAYSGAKYWKEYKLIEKQ